MGQLELGLTLRLGLVTPLYLLGILVLYRGTRGAQNAAVVLPLVLLCRCRHLSGSSGRLAPQRPLPHGDRPPAHLHEHRRSSIPAPGPDGHIVVVGANAGAGVFRQRTGCGSLHLVRVYRRRISFVPLIVRFRAEKASRNAFLTELRDELKSAHLVALTKSVGGTGGH